jgi:hypothetical protein
MNYCIAFMSSLLLQILVSTSLSAANEVIPTGSYIINMGVAPQTYATGLKPYGLIHTLIKDYQVPIKWSINPNKPKDGIDFTYNGQDFKGGPFIISATYRTPKIDSVVNAWKGQGVVVTTTTTLLTVPIYTTITYFTMWILDDKNGDIAEQYLINTNIPPTSYRFVEPDSLQCCHDLYVMPHADPTWATHKNLLYWNADFASGGCDGAIWAACHAVSVLENLYNPLNPTERMNFLMNNPPSGTESAVPFGSHADGTPAYTYRFDGHPVMQFMGTLDAATQNGSEQIFLPRENGWRPTTSIAVYDPTQANVPALSPGEAAVLAYGAGKGDSTRGRVMYLGAHNHNRASDPPNVAAQRAFLNFSLWSAETKAIHVLSSIPSVMLSGSSYAVAVTATGGGGGYTYKWTSSCGGTFANSTAASTTFTPTIVSVSTTCTITCLVKDYCGTRLGFETITMTVLPPPPTVGGSSNATVVCIGGKPTLTASVVGGAGTTTFQWQSSENNTTWSDIMGATAANYPAPALTTATYFRVLVTQTGCICTVPSNSTLISVVPYPTVVIQSSNDSTCVGGNITLTATPVGGAGSCGIQWQKSADSGANWLDIFGANSLIYIISNVMSSLNYRAIYTCSGLGCCN